MKKLKTILLFCCLLLGWCVLGVKAQNGTVAACGEATDASGSESVSYTIGLVNYITVGDVTSGTITQGVQQPYEFWVVTGLDQEQINLSMGVYPNPATDYVMLQIDDFENHLDAFWTYELWNVEGKLMYRQVIAGASTRIVLSGFSTGVYFLKVHQNEQELKVFKVVKNQ
jgi:hypothetical protein